MKIAVCTVATIIIAIILYQFFPRQLASVVLTKDEINAAAVIIAQRDYRREYDWETKEWIPDVITIEDANQSLILDEGERPDLIAKDQAYKRSFSTPTVYTKYVKGGCKTRPSNEGTWGEIEMPELKVKSGYHITRSMGSAMLVKDGSPEPKFSCIEGYRWNGTECSK